MNSYKLKHKLKCLSNALFLQRNGFLIALCIILCAMFFTTTYFAYIITAGVILVISSILYYLLFEVESEQENFGYETSLEQINFTQINDLINERNDNLTPIIGRIIVVLNSIIHLDISKYKVISEHMCDIMEFQKIIPGLVISCRKAADFVSEKEHKAQQEILNTEKKISESKTENARNTFSKALEQKKQTFAEILKVKRNMEENEANLYFILSALEKIETIIKTSEITNTISTEETDNIKSQFEVFSETIKNVSKKIVL